MSPEFTRSVLSGEVAISDTAQLGAPYPQQAQYKGSGATDDVANFVCAVPAK